jgi:hypothetical protein
MLGESEMDKKVIAPAIAIDSNTLEVINQAVNAEKSNYGARKALAKCINMQAPENCRWYTLEANGQKLPPAIDAIKSEYYKGLKSINYSNPSNAWKMIKQYAQEHASECAMFGEVPPEPANATESTSESKTREVRSVQTRLIEDLTALHEYMVREINKGNAEITSAHKQAHFHIVEGLKSIGKTIGL